MLITIKKGMLILSKGLRDGLDDTTLTAEAEYSVNFSKQHQKNCLSWHYNIKVDITHKCLIKSMI